MAIHALIVDDSRLARRLLKDQLLQIENFSINEAANGKEALEYCDENNVDIMFLDLTMPEVDGYQVLQELQNKKTTFPIIVISADIQPKAKERVISLGATAFLEKRSETDNLSDLLSSIGILS